MCSQEIGLGRTFIVAILKMLEAKIRFILLSEKFGRVKEIPHGLTMLLLLAQTVEKDFQLSSQAAMQGKTSFILY